MAQIHPLLDSLALQYALAAALRAGWKGCVTPFRLVYVNAPLADVNVLKCSLPRYRFPGTGCGVLFP